MGMMQRQCEDESEVCVADFCGPGGRVMSGEHMTL